MIGSFLFNNFLLSESINIAPSGAVINIDTTAAVRTNVPQLKPSLNAIAPIEACTVALGKYEMTINIFSFQVNFVAITQHITPKLLNISAIKINPTMIAPSLEKA